MCIMYAAMYTKVTYLVLCYMISISCENIEFVHPIKFHIVINIKKADTLQNKCCFPFLKF